MIHITFAMINDMTFTRALARVAESGKLNIKDAYNAGRINKEVQLLTKEARGLFKEMFAKHADVVRNDAGEIDFGKSSITPDKQPAFDEEEKSFLSISKQLEYWPLKLESLQNVGLSGTELVALEPILDQGSEQPATELKSVK